MISIQLAILISLHNTSAHDQEGHWSCRRNMWIIRGVNNHGKSCHTIRLFALYFSFIRYNSPIFAQPCPVIRSCCLLLGIISPFRMRGMSCYAITHSKIVTEEADVRSSTKKSRTSFEMLRNIWYSTQICKNLKVRIFKTNVLSSLQYGWETWKITDSIVSSIQVFVNKCLQYNGPM